MIFNVLAHNKDDHVRNFAFVHLGQAGWLRMRWCYNAV